MKTDCKAKCALGSSTMTETGTPVKDIITTVYILIPGMEIVNSNVIYSILQKGSQIAAKPTHSPDTK